MKMVLSAILKKIYVFYALLIFVIISLVLFMPTLGFFLPGDPVRKISFKFMWLWVQLFCIFTGIRYKVHGLHHVKQNHPYIITSNHNSFLDIPAMALFFPGQYYPLAKKELLKIPILGWMVKYTCVVVDRSDAESRQESLDELKKLLNKGHSVLIYPEGHQNRTSEPLTEFYSGAFKLALETNTDILPVIIKNSGKLMPPDKISLKPGKIDVYFDEPIRTNQHNKDVNDLRYKVYNHMLAKIKQIDNESS